MMGTQGIRVGTLGIRVRKWVIRVGTRGIKVGMREIRVTMRGMGVGVQGIQEMWGIRVGMRESGWFFVRIFVFIASAKFRGTRKAFHHPAFMGSSPRISHTLFALSTKFMSSPSREWGRGLSPRFHILVFMFGVNQEN